MSMRLGVAAALVDGSVVPGDVVVDGGAVREVGVSPARASGTAVPGLVDLQVNGVGSVDLRTADERGHARAVAELASHGVTAFQPTFHSQPIDAHERSLAVLGEVRSSPPEGSRVLPAHLEGPFLSASRRGAHDVVHLLEPDLGVLERLLSAGPVGMVTVAPELDGARALVSALVREGVVVSLGHTDASAAQVREAVGWGARHVTHLWNAHRPVAARDPGLVGVALAGGGEGDRVTVGLVGDLVHVDAELVRLTMRAAPGRVAVTADLVALGPGLRVADGAARSADGSLAGGAAHLDQCLRNLVTLGVDLAAAVDACGGAQRRLLGLPACRLRPGHVADVVVLNDELRPVRTLVGGVERWSA